jgi:membrane-associated protease RseP (regulator of RpoE activity)
MAVQVKVNGTGPYRLVFDTGAPMNLVSNKLAREAGLLKKGERPVLPLFGMGGPKTIQTLEIGAVKLQNVPAVVMDHPTVGAMAKVLGPIEGIIGFPFFARYKTTVDYQKRELTLVPNGYEPKDVMQGLMEKLMNPPKGKPEPRILAPAALWGFQVDKANDDTQEGVTVTRVLPDSPADQAGLRPGDRLLTLDGRWTDSVADTYAAAEAIKPGQKVVVVVLRKGQRLELSITPRAGF